MYRRYILDSFSKHPGMYWRNILGCFWGGWRRGESWGARAVYDYTLRYHFLGKLIYFSKDFILPPNMTPINPVTPDIALAMIRIID